MKGETIGTAQDRFLVLAPTGRDAALTCQLLARAGLEAVACGDVAELCRRTEEEGAAGLLLAEEALSFRELAQLGGLIARQESWSDIPIILFVGTDRTSESGPAPTLLRTLGKVTLLDRPVRPITMVSAVRAALRGRRRQYAARGELMQKQQAVQQRDEFLAMLGHELRNPLQAMRMAVDLMGGGGASDDQRDYLAVLRRQTEHLTRLVDDLLDVSRITSGKIVLQRSRLDLGELLRRCVQSIHGAAEAQGLALGLEAPAHPVVIDGDAVRLEQTFVNLLINAIKYTPAPGRIDVVLSSDGNEAVVEISDTGVGISEEMLPLVFDLFAQADVSLDRAKGGLGIGLTMVRTLTGLHGGSVTAASPGPGKGSVFSVRLPLGAGKRRAEGASVDDLTPAAVGYRILLVEDSADSRDLLQMILERHGHRITAVSDGATAVEKALSMKPDVMMIDIGLPGLDGYAVARRVREALGRETYLIAVTGYSQPEDRRRALEAGFDEHLSKPVDLRSLRKLLSRRDLTSRESRPGQAG